MRLQRIDPEKLRGLGDKVFGLAKELTGAVWGNERLEQEGEAQQARGSEKLKALRKQVEAEAHEAKADALEQRQKAAQRMKESA